MKIQKITKIEKMDVVINVVKKFLNVVTIAVNVIIIAVIAIAKYAIVQQDVVKYAVVLCVWDVVIYVLSTK